MEVIRVSSAAESDWYKRQPCGGADKAHARVVRLQRPRCPRGLLREQVEVKGDGPSGRADSEDLRADLQGHDAGGGTEEGREVARVILKSVQQCSDLRNYGAGVIRQVTPNQARTGELQADQDRHKWT